MYLEGEYSRRSNQYKDPKGGQLKEHKRSLQNNEKQSCSKVRRREKAVEYSARGAEGHCKYMSIYYE